MKFLPYGFELRGRIHNEKGSSLLYIIAGMVILAAVGAGMSKMSSTALIATSFKPQGDNAYYIALSGLNYVDMLQKDYQSNNKTIVDFQAAISGTPNLDLADGAKIELTMSNVTGATSGAFDISSKGIAASGASNETAFIVGRTNIAYTPSGGGGGMGDDDFVSGGPGDFTTSNQGKLKGSVFGDEVTLNNQAEITGDVIAKDDVTLNNHATVGGTICSGGDVTLQNGAESGTINAQGNVSLGSNGATVHGDVFAGGNVTLNNVASVEGSIHAGGYVILGSSSTAGGNVYANGNVTMQHAAEAIENVYSGQNIILESNAVIDKDAFAQGNIVLSGYQALIKGDATAGGVITTSGWESDVLGGMYPNTASPGVVEPTAPQTCIEIKPPKLTYCTPTESLSLGNQGTESFVAGTYCYSSINTGNKPTFEFDVTDGDITILVMGNVSFGNQMTVKVRNGGAWRTMDINAMSDEEKGWAAKVYLESHGNVTFNNQGRWFGTILASGNINFSNQTQLIGVARSTNGLVTTANQIEMYYVPSNYAMENWEEAD